MLFDPFEEQLDLPAAFVQSGNGQGRQGSVVGQEDQSLLGCWVLELDTARVFGVVLKNLVTVQYDLLVADKTAAAVHLGQVNALGVLVAFGTGHKEGVGLMHLEQASKVDVASAHDVVRAWPQDQDLQNIDLVHLAIADLDKGRNRASEVQQDVQLDGCLGFAKRRSVEQTQTQIDGGGIQRVDRVLEIEFQVLAQIKLASAPDQNWGQVGSDSPVARLVGIGQGGALTAVSKSHGVQLARVGSKRHFDVKQTLSPSQLSKSHDAKLLLASQAPQTRVTAIARHNARKAFQWNELHDLREQGLADTLRKPPSILGLRNYTVMGKRVLNRHQINWPLGHASIGIQDTLTLIKRTLLIYNLTVLK